ncbi:MAG: M23 family metallopeptidase [Spirochaetaceae bacterium]|nr:M23 family metallopeptidase [Spirochaetaceae bacterium]
MAQVHEYKRFENNVVKKTKSRVFAVGGALRVFFAALGRLMNRHYTLVLVPHSEKKIYNLQVTFFSMICAALVLGVVVGSFFWYRNSYNDNQNILTDKDSKLHETQASLDQLRDEVGALRKEARNFQNTLSGVFSTIGINTLDTQSSKTASGGDLSSFFDMRESAEGRLREADEIRSLASYLAETREPIENLGKLLESQSSLLTEVPNIWPIKGGHGHISMFFGENEHPFTGQIYVHRGIDLSTFRSGDPIVATADGQVVTVDYDPTGFGNYVIIRHKHGFYTRYGHMQSFKVRTGQRVQQGEVIGYIGKTGLTTGPHLHYEVHIGSDVVDPYKFLNVRMSAGRVNLNAGKS